jgi:hypothetical protein
MRGQWHRLRHAPELTSLSVKRVKQNAEKPCPRIRPRLELMEASPRQQQAFLNQVLGAMGRRQPPRHSQEAPRMAERNLLEFLFPAGH